MHKVARRAGRLNTELLRHHIASSSAGLSRHVSNWTPDNRDQTEKRPLAARASATEDHDDVEEAAENGQPRRLGFSRRTLRQRTAIVPDPPPLPAWFLQENVRLQPFGQDPSSGTEDPGLARIDAESEKTFLSFLDGKADADQRHTTEAISSPSVALSTRLQLEAIIRAIFASAGQNTSAYSASLAGLSLLSSDSKARTYLDKYVEDLAKTANADLVTIDAHDIAEFTGDFVGSGNDTPGTFSTLAHDVYDGAMPLAAYAEVTGQMSPSRAFEEEEQDEDEDEDADEDDESEPLSRRLKAIGEKLRSSIKNMDKNTTEFSFAVPAGILVDRLPGRRGSSSESNWVKWDDTRLTAVLEQMINASATKAASSSPPDAAPRSTIIHIRDLRNICRPKLGNMVIARMAKIVQKRRRLGEKILLLGTSSSHTRDSPIANEMHLMNFPIPLETESAAFQSRPRRRTVTPEEYAADDSYHRIAQINLRHITSMLRRLHPDQNLQEPLDMPQEWLLADGPDLLVRKALQQDIVHRLVLTAIGIALSAGSATVQVQHIAQAAVAVSRTQEFVRSRMAADFHSLRDRFQARFAGSESEKDTSKTAVQAKLDGIRRSCDSHEKRLFGGVVDAKNIKTGFEDVHVAPETIEALKTLTTLSLLRPDAFNYGILAKDNLSGLLLYGPPGTGKTLLAKAVAKEAKAIVLEVSGAQIYEKYVGEGEKMVRAVFTLAKKLSPCVVFIDEADALFGSRNNASNRTTHRELINQFLREWDGMDNHKVFIMVATNRPFDLDDAVLRRLPRRLLVDLPVAKDRENILGIHLRDELVDPSVLLPSLAERTPLYSGSDLKNLCVSAALAAVREEHDLATKHADDKDFALPEKRILHLRHFEKGLQDISASISEDMSSLNAIRKFDEKYGDRKGRRKKASYGFGALDVAVDENAARVRSGPT